MYPKSVGKVKSATFKTWVSKKPAWKLSEFCATCENSDSEWKKGK